MSRLTILPPKSSLPHTQNRLGPFLQSPRTFPFRLSLSFFLPQNSTIICQTRATQSNLKLNTRPQLEFGGMMF